MNFLIDSEYIPSLLTFQFQIIVYVKEINGIKQSFHMTEPVKTISKSFLSMWLLHPTSFNNVLIFFCLIFYLVKDCSEFFKNEVSCQNNLYNNNSNTSSQNFCVNPFSSSEKVNGLFLDTVFYTLCFNLNRSYFDCNKSKKKRKWYSHHKLSEQILTQIHKRKKLPSCQSQTFP